MGDSPSYKPGEIRSRSMPHPRPFGVAVFFSALHYFGIIAAGTAFAMFLMSPDKRSMMAFVASLGFSTLMWLIAFFKRRAAFCPLCKGTPLIDTGALTHAKSFRLPPLSYGTTAILSVISTQRFCCMYCGSRFDLLKKPSQSLTAERVEG